MLAFTIKYRKHVRGGPAGDIEPYRRWSRKDFLKADSMARKGVPGRRRMGVSYSVPERRESKDHIKELTI